MPGEEMPGGVTVFAAGQGGCQRVEVGESMISSAVVSKLPRGLR